MVNHACAGIERFGQAQLANPTVFKIRLGLPVAIQSLSRTGCERLRISGNVWAIIVGDYQVDHRVRGVAVRRPPMGPDRA